MEITVGILVLGGIITTVASTGFSAGVAWCVLKFGIGRNTFRIDQHEKRLDSMEEKQDDISEKVTRMDANLENLKETATRIENAICKKTS